jgi:nucleoside 2-deoxyribosyltransferase
MSKINVYVSGALTGIENAEKTKEFYEAIGSVCEEVGLQPYVPHLTTDPTNNPDVTPQKVFETDKHQVSKADLVIAYLGYTSFGVGMELAYAEVNNIPLILLYEEGRHISRFPRGIPTLFAEIQFSDHKDGLMRLKKTLEQWQQKQQKQF